MQRVTSPRVFGRIMLNTRKWPFKQNIYIYVVNALYRWRRKIKTREVKGGPTKNQNWTQFSVPKVCITNYWSKPKERLYTWKFVNWWWEGGGGFVDPYTKTRLQTSEFCWAREGHTLCIKRLFRRRYASPFTFQLFCPHNSPRRHVKSPYAERSQTQICVWCAYTRWITK